MDPAGGDEMLSIVATMKNALRGDAKTDEDLSSDGGSLLQQTQTGEIRVKWTEDWC